MYLTLLPVVRHGRLAMLDGAVVCFSLGMLFCFLKARRDLRWAIGGGLGFGLIGLTKGILSLLLGAIALLFLLWDTPRLLRCPYLWWGIILGSTPVAFWYGAQIWHYDNAFIHHALFQQAFNRIWSNVENHSGPPWYYLWEIAKVSWPWLIFWPAGYQYAWQNRNLSWAKFSLTWSGVYFVVISLMETKLPWYALPLYPPLALIGGMQLSRLWRGEDVTGLPRNSTPIYPKVWLVSFAILACIAGAGAVYLGTSASSNGADLLWVLLPFAFTLSIATILIAYQDSQFLTVLILGTYVSLLILMQSNLWVWELAESYPVKPVAMIVKRGIPPGRKVYTSYPDVRPSLDFYSDRQVLPATDAQFRKLWKESAQPYFLLDAKAKQNLSDLKSVKTIGHSRKTTTQGRIDEWFLITRLDDAKPDKTP
jgi:4-amino-4-deoxy-L-arabinose transferase-like glycosyltransferase